MANSNIGDSESQISPFSVPWFGPEPTEEEIRDMLVTGYIGVITGIPLVITDAFAPVTTLRKR